MSLLDYWPTAEEVNNCIKPEAEGADDAVLLAVHQPTPLAYRLPKSSELIDSNEGELFAHFITPNVPTGAHVVPITGHSGVGKSHLVRLLAARLKTVPNPERYHVVRIPKSASLRRVVELILEALPADRYAVVREAFENALAEVDPETAVIRFQSALDIALKDMAQELRSRLTQNAADSALKERLHHALLLPLLLSDAATREHFRTGTLRRIVEGAVSGRNSLRDEPLQFSSSDLDLPNDVDLEKAAEKVRFYYRTVLQARAGRSKAIAADVLNEVIDPAIRQSFQLNDALGGMTLQDVILEIRRLLLAEGRELVLLVEDFRALTGIQETLLNVLIQEGIRDGIRIYATMRSAIAVTDGYLTGRDTIATRAAREWVIQSHLRQPDEVLERTRKLVASYLNAARWGESSLKAQRRDRAGHSDAGAPVFESEQVETLTGTLDGFGRILGISLFPLTDRAIAYFANEHLKESDELVFKPRAIIMFLRDVLLLGRTAFGQRSFPPASLKLNVVPVEDVAQWLGAQRMPPEQRARYERVLLIWGNRPQNRNEIAHIPQAVFEAFSLPIPTGLESPQPTSKLNPSSSTPPPLPAVRPVLVDVHAKAVDEYRRELDAWMQPDGPLLSPGTAHQLRTALSNMLTERIDWNQERRLKAEITATQISVPHARGTGREKADAIAITRDRSDPNGQLRAELLAVLRFHHLYRQNLDYSGADDDLARIGNLLARLLPQALSLIRIAASKQAAAAVSLLASNSRFLGLTESGGTPNAVNAFLFGTPEPVRELPTEAPEPLVEWARALQSAAMLRPLLIQEVQKTVGCFQGTGNTAHAIDIMRVVEALSARDEGTAADTSFLSADTRNTLSSLTDIRLSVRAKRVAAETDAIRRRIETALGSDIDKNETADALLQFAEEVRKSGIWPETELGVSFTGFKSLCEEFRKCALKETLGQLDRVKLNDSTQPQAALIAQVAKVDLRPLLTAERFTDASDKVLAYGDRHAKTLEAQCKGARPDVHIAQLTQTFERLTTELEALQE